MFQERTPYLVIVLLVVALAATAFRSMDRFTESAAKWEYKVGVPTACSVGLLNERTVQDSRPHCQSELNELGAQGWELITADTTNRFNEIYTFKRRIHSFRMPALCARSVADAY